MFAKGIRDKFSASVISISGYDMVYKTYSQIVHPLRAKTASFTLPSQCLAKYPVIEEHNGFLLLNKRFMSSVFREKNIILAFQKRQNNSRNQKALVPFLSLFKYVLLNKFLICTVKTMIPTFSTSQHFLK